MKLPVRKIRHRPETGGCPWCSHQSQQTVVIFIFLKFPAFLLPLSLGARLLLELPGRLQSEKLCPEYLSKIQPLGSCFRFQCHQDLGIPTPNSTPGPRTVEALPSRFVSSEPTVVSVETVTQKSSLRGRKDICAKLGSLLTLLRGRGVLCPHCTGSPCPDASGDRDRDERSIKCCSNHCMSNAWGGPVCT